MATKRTTVRQSAARRRNVHKAQVSRLGVKSPPKPKMPKLPVY